MAAHDALRTILPVAGWPAGQAEERARRSRSPAAPIPSCRRRSASARPAPPRWPRPGSRPSDLWELRTGRRQTGRGRSAPGDGVVAQRPLPEDGKDRRLARTQPGHGRCIRPRTAAGATSTPISRTTAPPRSSVLGLRRRPRGGGAGGREMGRARTGGGDHRRQGRRRHGAQHGRMGRASAGRRRSPRCRCWRSSRSATAPAEKLPPGDRPLSGIRVLDLTRVLAGPTCARTLAEHGADVLKITAPHLPNLGYQEFDTGHGKLSAHLDLREPQGCWQPCAGWCARPTCSRRATGRGRWAAAACRPRNWRRCGPGLVYVSLCAFSHAGPWASRRGFDTVVQTVSGITSRQGELFPGAEPGPQFYPVSAIDYLTGYLMAFGAMVALARRAREGGSWLVRISLAQSRALARRAGARCRKPQLKDVAAGVHAGGAGALVDGERHAGRAPHPSGAGRAIVRDAAVLGAALGAARLQRAGLAGARLARPRMASAKAGAAPPIAPSPPSGERVGVRGRARPALAPDALIATGKAGRIRLIEKRKPRPRPIRREEAN